MEKDNSIVLLELKDKLKDYLKKIYVNEANLDIENFKHLKVGFSGDIYSFSLILDGKMCNMNNNLILKVYWPSINGINIMKKECEVIKKLYKEGFPVPKLVAEDTTLEIFGRPFLVMEEKFGDMLWDSYKNASNDKKDNLIITFVYLLFQLHSIDVKNFEPSFDFDAPELIIDLELAEIKNMIESHNTPEFNDIYQWLVENKENILDLKPTVIHRDYHPWNIIEHDDGDFYVLDWGLGIGDYRFDLAWTVTLMEISGFKELADRVLYEYEFILDDKIQSLEYFKVLSTLRWILDIASVIKSGGDVHKNRVVEFKERLEVPIEKALLMFKDITELEVSFIMVS